MRLVFGKTGQVATELQRLAPDAQFAGRDEANLTDPAACAALIEARKPSAVINAAAYTATDKAEEDQETAALVNGEAPAAMARACAGLGIPFVHISTDYVFDGTGDQPFKPTDPTGPMGAYGRTKLAGEEGVRAAGGAFAILRTSWVFSAHGSNFVETMLRLGGERDTLSIVADQVGGPTSARSIAEACLTIADQLTDAPEKLGTYHFSGAADVSWAGFGRAIFKEAGITCEVINIPSSAYPSPFKRPENSRLECGTTKATFGIARPNWRDDLRATITELKDSQ